MTAELADRVPKRGGEKERKKESCPDRRTVPRHVPTYAYVLGEGPDRRTAPEIQERTRAVLMRLVRSRVIDACSRRGLVLN